MVDHHDAGAAQPLGLVHQQVAALVVHVVGDDEALCKRRGAASGKAGRQGERSSPGWQARPATQPQTGRNWGCVQEKEAGLAGVSSPLKCQTFKIHLANSSSLWTAYSAQTSFSTIDY